MDALLVGALLLAVLLGLVALMVWQEAQKTPLEHQPVYVLEEAAKFIFPQLSDAAIDRLDRDDIVRILEWEVAYLQGVGAIESDTVYPVRVAGSDDAAEFVKRRLAEAGHQYELSDIKEVLYHESTYLIDIGAIGFDEEASP